MKTKIQLQIILVIIKIILSSCRNLIECASDTFLYKSTCVSKCPSGYYGSSGNCLSTCPTSPSSIVTDTKNNICVDCSTNSTYSDNNQCVSKCSDNNGYMINNSCVSECPYGYGSDPFNMASCFKCSLRNKYYFNHQCYDSCPIGAIQDEDKKMCYTCSSLNNENIYMYKNTCVSSCPENAAVDSFNICNTCGESQTFYYNNTCYTMCPYNTQPDFNRFLCVPSVLDSCVFAFCYNDGVCKSNSITLESLCECKVGYYGTLCQYDIKDVKYINALYSQNIYLSYLINSNDISEKDMYNLLTYSYLNAYVPGFFNDTLSFISTVMKIAEFNSNGNKYFYEDTNIFQDFLIVFNLLFESIIKYSKDLYDQKAILNYILNLKNYVLSYTEYLMKNNMIKYDSNSQVILKYRYFKIQIFPTDKNSFEIMKSNAIQSKLSIVDISNCVEYIRIKYSSSNNYLLKKIEWIGLEYNFVSSYTITGYNSSIIDLNTFPYFTSSVVFDLFDSVFNKVNVNSLCKDIDRYYKFPYDKSHLISLNTTTPLRMLQQNSLNKTINITSNKNIYTIDYYNGCIPFSFSSMETVYDYTPNYIKEYFLPNFTIFCGGLVNNNSNINYTYIPNQDCYPLLVDSNNYINCLCTGSHSYSSVNGGIFNKLSYYNSNFTQLNYIICISVIMSNFTSNNAFIIGLVLIIFMGILIFLLTYFINPLSLIIIPVKFRFRKQVEKINMLHVVDNKQVKNMVSFDPNINYINVKKNNNVSIVIDDIPSCPPREVEEKMPQIRQRIYSDQKFASVYKNNKENVINNLIESDLFSDPLFNQKITEDDPNVPKEKIVENYFGEYNKNKNVENAPVIPEVPEGETDERNKGEDQNKPDKKDKPLDMDKLHNFNELENNIFLRSNNSGNFYNPKKEKVDKDTNLWEDNAEEYYKIIDNPNFKKNLKLELNKIKMNGYMRNNTEKENLEKNNELEKNVENLEDIMTNRKLQDNYTVIEIDHIIISCDHDDFLEVFITDKKNMSFFSYLIRDIWTFHIFSVAFLRNSFISPRYIRVSFFFLYIFLMFLFNALYFFDGYLYSRMTNEKKNFIYVLKNEFGRVILSIVSTNIVLALLKIITRNPIYSNNLRNLIKDLNRQTIHSG